MKTFSYQNKWSNVSLSNVIEGYKILLLDVESFAGN